MSGTGIEYGWFGDPRDPHVAVPFEKIHYVGVSIPTSGASKHEVSAASVSRREVVAGLISGPTVPIYCRPNFRRRFVRGGVLSLVVKCICLFYGGP